MSHHFQELPPELQHDLRDQMIAEQGHGPGATGRHPDGKVHPADEGEIEFQIGCHDGRVFLNFGKPVQSMAMTPAECEQLEESLMRYRMKARGIDVPDLEDVVSSVRSLEASEEAVLGLVVQHPGWTVLELTHNSPYPHGFACHEKRPRFGIWKQRDAFGGVVLAVSARWVAAWLLSGTSSRLPTRHQQHPQLPEKTAFSLAPRPLKKCV